MSTLIDDDTKLATMLRLHMQGLSQRDVAEELEVSQRAVCYALKKLGITPNGYHTGASRLKRSRSSALVARLKRSTIPVPATWEAEWPVVAGTIPERLGYHTFAALSMLGAVEHGEPGCQILPLGDRLILRAAEDRIRRAANDLPAGTTLRIGGGTCRLGGPALRSTRNHSRLASWCVTAKGKTEEPEFQRWLRRDLSRMGVAAKIEVGARRVIKVKGRLIVGFAVTLARLHHQESLRIQAIGLGGRHRFGCGVFTAC